MSFNELGACLDVATGPVALSFVPAFAVSCSWGGLYHWLWMYDNDHFSDFRRRFINRLSSITIAIMVLMMGTATGGICMALEYEIAVAFMGWCAVFEVVGLCLSIRNERIGTGKHKSK